MRFLIDFLPIALFVAAYKYADIFTATGVLMAATLGQMALIYALDRKLQPMHKVTLAMVLGFGTLTIALHDERFIQWKPTVIYITMALALVAAMWVWKKNPIQMLLGSQMALPEGAWRQLSLVWIGFFLFLAAANAFVVMNYSMEAWVNFKLWGYVFWVPFLILQGVIIGPHMKQQDDGESMEGTDSP